MNKPQFHTTSSDGRVGFKFVLDFENNRIEVQLRNKLTLCKVNIALQTILSLRLCIAPAHD